jgi:hypothetical protein
MSAILSSLKLVNAKRQITSDPIHFRREKLSQKLSVQIQMAQSLKNGEEFSVKRMKKITDEFSGVTSMVEVNKRVRQWWFVNNETKRVAVQLFYGNKLIDLAKGKNAVEVSNGDELISVLTKLKDAINDGSLDTQIEVAADSVKARFQK